MSKPTKGQNNRDEIMGDFIEKGQKYAPEPIGMNRNKLIALLSYELGLCPDTIKYSYLFVCENLEIAYRKGTMEYFKMPINQKEGAEAEEDDRTKAEKILRNPNATDEDLKWAKHVLGLDEYNEKV